MIFESTYRRKALQTWDIEREQMVNEMKQSLLEQKDSVSQFKTNLKFPFSILYALRKH
jgi:hypothetical protein